MGMASDGSKCHLRHQIVDITVSLQSGPTTVGTSRMEDDALLYP